MAEKERAADAAAFRAMDHDLAVRRSGNWLPPIPPSQPMDPAAFNAMDHAVQYGPEHADASIMPPSEVGGQDAGKK